jgi:hypothetical protein
MPLILRNVQPMLPCQNHVAFRFPLYTTVPMEGSRGERKAAKQQYLTPQEGETLVN